MAEFSTIIDKSWFSGSLDELPGETTFNGVGCIFSTNCYWTHFGSIIYSTLSYLAGFNCYFSRREHYLVSRYLINLCLMRFSLTYIDIISFYTFLICSTTVIVSFASLCKLVESPLLPPLFVFLTLTFSLNPISFKIFSI